VTTSAILSGTSFGPELLIELRGSKRRAQLEDRLRELVRDGTLLAGTRLPSSRALADDLEVSRRLVVDAYAQLLAEGYLVSRHGAGTYVAATAATGEEGSRPRDAPPLRFDFFPGAPDLASFPRALWLRAMREVLRTAPPHTFAYPDVRGAPELRHALAGYLRRVRGVAVEPDAIVTCAGATHGLALLARALVKLGERSIAVEDPCLPPHRVVLSYAGLAVLPVAVDEHGLDAAALAPSRDSSVSSPDVARPGDDEPPSESTPRAVLATPAHQCPTGVVLSPARRAALIAWARANDALVIEDDYDAEFRYDRAPLGALQGLAPDHVAYVGTASKTLAPGMRLGWLVLPPMLLDAVVEAKLLDGLGSPVLDQLALARLIETAAYDRHLRAARRRNRARRDALLAAVEHSLPGACVSGISAGLHALVRLPRTVDAHALMAAAAQRSVGVYPLSFHLMSSPPETDAVVLGYAGLSEPAIAEGIARLAEALQEL
jgi:GntR family transcriptional regulator/MocR family aminotransferase